ncbi:MAG: hypothetical protein JNL83_10365 [Myxococcales bacterium]|nr:hypothetical protein [Myxococcales bacterium]
MTTKKSLTTNKPLKAKSSLTRKTPLVRKAQKGQGKPAKATARARTRPPERPAIPADQPPSDQTPAEIIDALALRYAHSSDPQIVAALGALPALRDEDDPAWDDEVYWSGVAFPYLALAQVAAARRLWPAIRLLLDRAAFGDPGETMRGLRSSLEAIAGDDLDSLAEACLAAIATGRPGTVLWAAEQLLVLDDPRAYPVFEQLRHSEHARIRDVAEAGIARLVPDAN